MGGHGVHQHRRRVGGLAARHVDADPVQRRDLLAQQRAVVVAVLPAQTAGLHLALVVVAHPVGGGLQGVALGWGDGLEGVLQLGTGQLQRGDALSHHAVKARGVVQHGGIAAHAHVGQDVGHPLLDGVVGLGRPVQHAAKLGFEIGVGGAELADVDGSHGGPIKLPHGQKRRSACA